MRDSWMLARLQRDTELFHGDADTHRLSMIGSTVTADRYRESLSRIYGFEDPVEAALAMAAGLDEIVDLRSRTQLKLLRADLIALAVADPKSLPRCNVAIEFRDRADALGWLYVLERNALIQGVVDRHLRERLPDVLKVAGNYFASRQRSAGARWRELGETLDRVAIRPSIADRIANAAKAAFRAQRGWYELEMPSRLRVA